MADTEDYLVIRSARGLGKAHRILGGTADQTHTLCRRAFHHLRPGEQVPLSQTAAEDRCRVCFRVREADRG